MRKDRKMNKAEIKVKRDDEEITIVVKKPTPRQESEANIEAASYVNTLLSRGVNLMPKSKVAQYIEEQNLWSDEKIKELEEVSKKIADGEKQLKRGGKTKDGKRFSKQDAKELAVNMRVWRVRQIELFTENYGLYDNCLENVKDDRNFDYLVSVCCLDEEGNRIFNNLDHYIDESGKEYARESAKALKDVIFNNDEDWTLDLPETKWLIRYDFANEEGTLLSEDGIPLTELEDESEEEIDFVEYEDEEDNEEEAEEAEDKE